MSTTILSSKGQVIIPKIFRQAQGWQTGLRLQVIETDGGLLLKPAQPFSPSTLAEVAGMLKDKAAAKTDAEIELALRDDVKRRWHGRS